MNKESFLPTYENLGEKYKRVLHQKQRIGKIYYRRRRVALSLLSVITFGLVFSCVSLYKSYASEPQSKKVTAQTKNLKHIKHVTGQTSAVKNLTATTPQVQFNNLVYHPVDKPTTKTIHLGKAKPSNQSTYNPHIPMPKAQQEYLYKLCKKRGLDYKKTLALIHHESRFNPNELNSTNDYGLFQINQKNHLHLAKVLHTDNSAFNPYININWGTYMLSNLYKTWGSKGLTGAKLDKAVWSSYNEGIEGYRHNGEATRYITQMGESISFINHCFYL
ncbi:transglycosylase SLT domain-containing protein (plasmid) [Aneurinibacillus sp. Ricciae_BoGa-3]|uniref:transglycosylase SLT domain-containing protein n=1 Tax=Aneurinibacillus sp. Ricciae_BoGa-3 TaxID=3022697 RepID=UPI002341DD96|nr:transglycosylase SLT domain-containing protein [Aneurinibacillus sp. Ricciae_BoGa-3]WCK57095.1 transglycosylase SLT domain-containing protein [Aneurinibacillus sp. Ricciae_BoGa-3]